MEYRAVSLDYFLDQMQEYEASLILQGLQYSNKDLWEAVRTNIYFTTQMMSKKQLKPTDLIKFGWDSNEEKTTGITTEEIEDIKAKAEEISNKYIKNGK